MSAPTMPPRRRATAAEVAEPTATIYEWEWYRGLSISGRRDDGRGIVTSPVAERLYRDVHRDGKRVRLEYVITASGSLYQVDHGSLRG